MHTPSMPEKVTKRKNQKIKKSIIDHMKFLEIQANDALVTLESGDPRTTGVGGRYRLAPKGSRPLE